MLKKINGVEVPMSQAEIDDYNERERLHNERKAMEAKTAYARARQAEYPTIEEMVVAMWEAEMEQNVDAMEALQAKRLAVKAKYPKPSKE